MTCIVFDIETSFLHGDFDEEVSIKVPKGITIGENKNSILRKTIYGLIQSARKFYEKLINVLKVIGFHGSKFDPCFWIMWVKKVNYMMIFGIYADDCLIIGKEENIASLIDELKNHEFNLKVERNVNEYLICFIEESKDEGKLTMIQPHLLTHLIQILEMNSKGKGSSLLRICQDLRFKSQQSIWMFLMRIITEETDLELECYST
jgi:hypothetical protein